MRSKLIRTATVWFLFALVNSLAWGTEPGDRGLVLMRKDGTEVSAHPLGFTVETYKSGMTAQTLMTLYFDNPSKETLDGVYGVSLPEDAVVDTVWLTVDHQSIEGYFQEKHEARQTYEAAKQRGLRAGLIERQEPGAFTMSVANLGPGESAQILLQAKQIVRWEHGRFRLKVPWRITVDTEADWDKDLDLGEKWTPEGVEPESGMSPRQADEIVAAMLELGPRHSQVTGDMSLVVVNDLAAGETPAAEFGPVIVGLSDTRDIILSYQESMPAEIRCPGLRLPDPETAPVARDPWEVLREGARSRFAAAGLRG
jgi:Ca-activated chloride channel family protein